MTDLYLITPPRIEADFAARLADALDAGPVAALQIRLKDHAPDEIRTLAPPLIRLAQERGVAAILNDDAELAAELQLSAVAAAEMARSFLCFICPGRSTHGRPAQLLAP